MNEWLERWMDAQGQRGPVIGMDPAGGPDATSSLVKGEASAELEAQIAAMKVENPNLIVMRIP